MVVGTGPDMGAGLSSYCISHYNAFWVSRMNKLWNWITSNKWPKEKIPETLVELLIIYAITVVVITLTLAHV